MTLPMGCVEHNLAELKALEMDSRTRGWFRSLIERCQKEASKEALRELLDTAGESGGGD